MNTGKFIDTFSEFKLLNKKRAKSKDHLRYKSKSKDHKKKEHRNKSKRKIISKLDDVKEIKKLDNVKLNYRHFFHVNWEDNIYTKEVVRIGEAIDPYIYWFLINSSYFVEENIQENIKKIKEDYFDYKSEYINKRISNNSNEAIIDHNANNDCLKEHLNNESIDFFNNKYKKSKRKDKDIISVVDYLNHDINSFINVFGYSSAKAKLSIFKNKLINYINIIHQINKDKINFIEKKAKDIEEEYNNKNSYYKEDYIKWINEDPMYEKNNTSYAIQNKYANYLYIEEKADLLKQEYFFDDQDEGKKEEDDDEELNNNCLICNNCDVTQYSSYYECLQCSMKVHPFCYGIKLKTEPKRWKCDLCKEMPYTSAKKNECLLCPNKGGAMKKTNISKNSEIYRNLSNLRKEKIPLPLMNPYEFISFSNGNNNNIKTVFAWVHLSCALWNKDVQFGNYETKSNISLLSQNIYNNYNSLCSICHKDNYGPTIKCKKGDCNFQCHPECGRINNCFLEVILVDRVLEYNIYCHNHHPNKFAKLLNNIITYNTELIYAFDDSLRRVFHTFRLKYKKDFYFTKKDDEFIRLENSIKIIEDNEEESIYSNCNSVVSHKSDKNNKSSLRNKLYFKKKKKNKIKIIKVDNNDNENYVKSIEIDSKDMTELKYKKHYLNEFILSPYKINNNITEFLDDKNINSNLNSEFSKVEKNLHNILITENTQSKTISSSGVSINLTQNENNSINNDNSTIINNISNINNIKNINIINNIIVKKNLELKANIEPVRVLTLEEEIEKNKESFITYLIGFLDSYYNENSVVLKKGDQKYSIFKSEEDNPVLEGMCYDDLFKEDFPVHAMHYKDFSFNYIKKYLKKIFTDEESFDSLFIDKIDDNLKILKKNEKLLKNKKIICRNMDKCVGKKNGIYNLLDVERFKYQIFEKGKDIPKDFMCDACLNYNDCDEDFDE